MSDWGNYRRFVGFYWTLPVKAVGFTKLSRDVEAAARASKTIAYQRARIRAYVAEQNGTLVGEITYLEPDDRPSSAIEPEITRALKLAQKESAQLLYVAFAEHCGWRDHKFLQQQTSLAPVSCLGLPPDPIHLEDLGAFDPIAHFRASRRILDGRGTEADRRLLLETQVRALLDLDVPDAIASPAVGARRLNDVGVRTLRGNAWTADNLRQFLKAMRSVSPSPKPRRVAIVGSRGYPSPTPIEAFVARLPKDTIIVSGGARGVDSWAETAVGAAGLATRVHRADWDGLGRKAGPLRNAAIVADCDEVVAFWDGRSRGTLNTAIQAVRASLPVQVFDAKGDPVPIQSVMQVAERQGVVAAIERAHHSR